MMWESKKLGNQTVVACNAWAVEVKDDRDTRQESTVDRDSNC
jgi:hypothetical protein